MLFSAVSVDCENSLWTFSGSSGADFFCSILSRVVSSVKYAIIIVSLKKKSFLKTVLSQLAQFPIPFIYSFNCCIC